jgi:hypothetical protein
MDELVPGDESSNVELLKDKLRTKYPKSSEGKYLESREKGGQF